MANLVELFDNIVQMQNLNGVPLAAGKLYVYALGRTRLMDSWSDVDGESLNPNPIILDDAGQAHVYVSDDFDYTLVVCDQYNNEIFSLDKYLYSKGSHSHADVAVAPSESIAVSSYHVGECTVYVPYLTGQLGKVYEGIDPIVVNNQVDKISANHVPLGVQDPLYFVQDDEEACIIGCSAQTEIPSALSSKWDEASDAVIANSAQWSEGATYEAGSYIDIDGHTINVTGLQPAGNYQSAGDYVVHDELSSYATQDWVNEQGFLTAIPPEYVTENTLQSGLSSKLDSTAFSTVSGNFLTAHQSLDGLMSADLLEISDNKITGYNGTAFAGQGGGVSGDFTLVEGNGIQLTDDPIAQTTTISVSGDYATQEDIESATSGKANTTALLNYVPRSGLTDDNLSARLDYYGLHLSSKYNNNASSYANYGTFGINTYVRSADIINYAAQLELVQTGLYMYQSSAYGSGGSGRASLNHNYLNLESVNGKAYISVNDYYLLNIYQSGNNQSPSFISFDRGNGLSYSAENDYIGQFYTQISSDMNVPRYNPVWIVKNGSGDGFSIGASEAKGFDKDGNTIWSTKMSKATQLINGSNDLKPAILLTPMPTTTAYTAQWTAAPYVSADYQSLTISYGPTASVPNIKIMPDDITTQTLTGNSARASFGLQVAGVRFDTTVGTWSLTGSVQKREIECDTATSAITAIAGSAIGGGGGVPQSAFDELKQSYDALSALFAQYSGQWLLPNEGEE